MFYARWIWIIIHNSISRIGAMKVYARCKVKTAQKSFVASVCIMCWMPALASKEDLMSPCDMTHHRQWEYEICASVIEGKSKIIGVMCVCVFGTNLVPKCTMHISSHWKSTHCNGAHWTIKHSNDLIRKMKYEPFA